VVLDPLWSSIAVALTVAFAGLAAYAFRLAARREETIRRQLASESALKARFDEVFERSSDLMIVHDRRGRVSTINRAAEYATGYSRDEVRVLDPEWIFGADYQDAIRKTIAEGAEHNPQEFRTELSATARSPA
jgi:PAS domain-containing protein